MSHVDDAYPDALARFHQAIDDLLAPRPVTTIHGHRTILPAIPDQVAEGKAQGPADDPATGSSFESKPPVWLGKVDWEGNITRIVSTLAGGGHWDSPRAALEWAGAHTWGTHRAADLDRAAIALHLARWEGLRLLHPVLFMVTSPCPECGDATTTRNSPDGQVTVSTLAVRDLWAECEGCGAQWWGADIVTVLAVGVAERADQAAAALDGIGESSRALCDALDGLAVALDQ